MCSNQVCYFYSFYMVHEYSKVDPTVLLQFSVKLKCFLLILFQVELEKYVSELKLFVCTIQSLATKPSRNMRFRSLRKGESFQIKSVEFEKCYTHPLPEEMHSPQPSKHTSYILEYIVEQLESTQCSNIKNCSRIIKKNLQ